MTETTDTPETTDVAPLAKSINHCLTDLAAHACAHGQAEGRSGIDDKEMPECLADHVTSLAATLFGLTKPEEANSSIATSVEIPIDAGALPEGLIEGLQKAVNNLAETMAAKS